MMKKRKKNKIDNEAITWDDRPQDIDAALDGLSEEEYERIYERLFDKPYEKDREQKIFIRTLMRDTLGGADPYIMLDDLSNHTVIIICNSEYEQSFIECNAYEVLNRNCRDIVFCGNKKIKWHSVFKKKQEDLNLRVVPQYWTIECVDKIEESLWICKDKILILCCDRSEREIVRLSMRESIDRLAEIEKKLGMTWGEWILHHDEMSAWNSEIDWWEDPLRRNKLTREDHDFLSMHDEEWYYYCVASRLSELDSKYKRKKVIGTYKTSQQNFLICEKFPSGSVREYVHDGEEAYMSIDGEHNHGFMIYQSKPEEVFAEIRAMESMPAEFTLVSLNTEKDLSRIKYIYFL